MVYTLILTVITPSYRTHQPNERFKLCRFVQLNTTDSSHKITKWVYYRENVESHPIYLPENENSKKNRIKTPLSKKSYKTR